MRLLLAVIVAVLIAPLAFAGDPHALTKEAVLDAAKKLEERIHDAMNETGVPGIAVAIVFEDKLIFSRGFGVRKAGRPEPVDADTVFQLASVSKPVGATVVAAVIGDGAVVSWDSRIRDLDPSFAMYKPFVTEEITVRDLYAHRSGLPDHAGDWLEDMGYPREEILRRLRFQKPDTSFRSHYAYTNLGLTAAAVAVAKSTGKTWEELSEERLYRPLGMASTSSRQKDFLSRKNRASGHVLVDGKWVAKYQRDPEAESPAGGVSSSINDLAKWMRLQLSGGRFEGKEIVASAALEESHHPHILTGFNPLNGLPFFYGLGWNVNYDVDGQLLLTHSGAFNQGASTAVCLLPGKKLGIVILTNSAPVGLPEALSCLFVDDILHGGPTADWLKIFKGFFAEMIRADLARYADYSKSPQNPVPARNSASYVGTYSNDLFGEVEVVEKDGKLFINLGPGNPMTPLAHWDRDTFTFSLAQESLIGTSGIFFAMGPDGQARGATIECLNAEGQGVFQRKTPGGK
ncbi:MAG: serine hydrolase [Chthoniobacterales bacterium]